MAKRIHSEADPNQISLLASAATAAAVLEEPMPAPAASSGSVDSLAAMEANRASESGFPASSTHAGKPVVNGALPQTDKLAPPSKRSRAYAPNASVRHNIAVSSEDHGGNHQAELFYLQKQIQQQIQMVFILEDGSRIQGVVEWYDRSSIKVRGKLRVLIYKSAIKYLYKAGEVGSSPGV